MNISKKKKEGKIKIEKANWFEWLLMNIVLRIARHWHCRVETMSAKKTYLGMKDKPIKWIKIVFTEVK